MRSVTPRPNNGRPGLGWGQSWLHCIHNGCRQTMQHLSAYMLNIVALAPIKISTSEEWPRGVSQPQVPLNESWNLVQMWRMRMRRSSQSNAFGKELQECPQMRTNFPSAHTDKFPQKEETRSGVQRIVYNIWCLMYDVACCFCNVYNKMKDMSNRGLMLG